MLGLWKWTRRPDGLFIPWSSVVSLDRVGKGQLSAIRIQLQLDILPAVVGCDLAELETVLGQRLATFGGTTAG